MISLRMEVQLDEFCGRSDNQEIHPFLFAIRARFQRVRAGGTSAAGRLDMRGFGESGGTRGDFKRMPEDVDSALEFLMSQPRVDHQVIGLGEAGWLGVTYSVGGGAPASYGHKVAGLDVG